MDPNTSARSPLSLSKPFYDDITKDIPSPVTKDFYDAISQSAEAKPAPVVSTRYELASPGEIAETVGAVGEAVIRTPLQIAGAAASAIRGGSRESMADKNSFLTRIIDRANQDAEDFQKKYADNKVVIAPLSKLGLPDDITTGTVTRFPQQAAFSAVSAGAGLAAGLGTAAVSGPAAPIAGRAAGMAASGGVAYRMQKDNSTKDLYDKLNATSMKTAGRELTPDEWKTAYDKNEGLLIEQGISEAVPEAIGNLVGFELFFGAAKNVFGKQLAKTTIGKALDKYGAGAAGKMLAEQATEQTTETWTQQWQHNIDVEMGLTPGETKRSWTSFDDLRKSNQEVFSDILLLSTIMGGAALAGEHIKDKMDTKASAQLVKDVVAEKKFDRIPNEFLPVVFSHAQELADKRPADKDLAAARDAFAIEMDKRGIDYDMTSKFKEYLKLDPAVKEGDATGEDVARWASLRGEFKEKNISPDLYQQYLAYQTDINEAVRLSKLMATGKASEPQKKEFARLTDSIASKATTFGFDPEDIGSTGGVAKGDVVRKNQEPTKSAARDILLGNDPAAKRKTLTAKDVLTEGDVDIQFEEDLTPEALAAIDKKLEIAGTGGARKPLDVTGETPGKVVDITGKPGTDESGTPSVFGRMPDDQLKGMADQGVKGAKDELARRASDGTIKVEVPKKEVGTPEGKINYAERIAAGESEGFVFSENYSPMDINDLWDDLSSIQEAIDEKNKPKIDALAQEKVRIKGDRSPEAKERRKQIETEMDRLSAEAGFARMHAENAFASAQERLGLAATEILKQEGIEVTETDQEDIYDLVSVLSDGKQNEQGWAKPILRQVVDEFKAAGTGGKRGPAEVIQPADKPKSARQDLDESVKKFRGEGHNINDNGVYIEPEKIIVPFSKASGREGEIRIAAGPDGKFRIGVSNSKKYGDFQGGGYAAAIDGAVFNTREEALKAGIDEIRKNTKGNDPKGTIALKELVAFEATQFPGEEIKAAGTGGARKPLEVKTGSVSPEPEIVASAPTVEGYAERMKNAESADEGRKLIGQYEEEFASIEREAGLKHSVGKGGSGYGGRGYSTLTSKKKREIVKNVTAKNPDLGKRLQSLINDIDASGPHWKTLLEKEHGDRGRYIELPAKAEEPDEIKAAGTGGARQPRESAESGKKEEPNKVEPPGIKRTTPALGTPERDQVKVEINEKTEEFQNLNTRVEELSKKLKRFKDGSANWKEQKANLDKLIDRRSALGREIPKLRDKQRLAMLEDAYENPRDEAQKIAAEVEIANILDNQSAEWKASKFEELKAVIENEAKAAGIPDADLKSVVLDLASSVSNTPLTDTYETKKYLELSKARIEEREKGSAEKIRLADEEKKRKEEAAAAAKKEAEAQEAKREEGKKALSATNIVTWEAPDGVRNAEQEVAAIEGLLGRKLNEDEDAIVRLREHKNVAIGEAKIDFLDLVRNSNAFDNAIRDIASSDIILNIGVVKTEPENIAAVKTVTEKKQIRKVVMSFASTDTTRVNLTGFYNDGGTLVATDGHRMIVLPDVEKDLASGKIYVPLKGGVGLKDLGDAQFPDYKRVLPERNPAEDIPIPRARAEYLVAMIKSTAKRNRLREAAKETLLNTFPIGLPHDKAVNGFYLIDTLEAALKLGADQIAYQPGEGDLRATCYVAQKDGKDIAQLIVMPLKLNDNRGLALSLMEKDLTALREAAAEPEPKEIKAAGTGGKRGENVSGNKSGVSNRDLTIRQIGDVGSRVRFKGEGQEKKVHTITEINDDGMVKIGKGQPFRFASDFVKVEEETPPENVIPHDGWETHIVKARKYAVDLGIAGDVPTWTSLDSIVETIKKHLGEVSSKEETAAPGASGEAVSEEKKAEEAKPGEKSLIEREVAAMTDADLDALLDLPEEQPPAKTNNEAIKRVFDAAREKRAGKIPSAKTGKALDDILSDVAKEGVAGASEALKGLYELFGGSSLKSFPGGLDEGTYLKAKPHFQAAYEHFIEVGKGIKEFAATIVAQFGDAIRPYLKQFLKDVRDGVAEEETAPINLDENTGRGEGGERKTRRKLTEQEKAERDAKAKAAEDKKARKAAMGDFQNVGYVYDPEKLNAKTKDKTPKSAAKIILDEMTPGKIWAVSFAEEATPGTVRLMTQMQKYFLTFKEFLTESRDRLRYSSGKAIEDRIEHWLNYSNGSIDTLKGWATEYGKAMQPVLDTFNGQTSITNVMGRLQETMLPGVRKADGAYPMYMEIRTSLTGLLGNREYTQKPNILYNFLSDSWQHLLADENDILLSEIDTNKRGRNKIVVRAGLPDYREGVELKKTEDFQSPFGFKGVGFGEEGWINQEERARVIPAAYDSFKDLAATIGAPDNGMSLGGELAVQFANLGHKAKGAAAAYFPSVQTINFTRDNGDGTMAHEWGHGLHDLAYIDAKDEIDAIIKTFYFVYDFDAGTRLVDDLLAKDSMFLKRMVSNKKQVRIEAVKNEVTERFEETVRMETDYYATAKQMDADYTARAQEMWARAFEAYIYDTLPGKNNYLVNDFVAAGRVGGKSGVGTKLVYPSGKERETFNATIKHFLEGLLWEDGHKPMLKDDYVTIEKMNELMLHLQLKFLLDQVEARYKAIWSSEPSKDGHFWYRYDDTSFGPMMQPDGYDGYDKAYTSEGQNGTGAVAYLTQLHPDAILDYKLSNIQYEGENPVYIAKERGGINAGLSEEGTEALEEVSAKPDGSPDEGGDVREGDGAGSPAGIGGTRTPGTKRGSDGSSEGDSVEGVHPSPAGNYRITDLTLNDPKSVSVRFGLNLSAVKILNLVESENRTPTDDEKDVLAQYSGWGGMSELFAWEPSAAWAGKAELLKVELNDDEIRDAASSSTSSYYTPVPVGQFMWRLAQRLGFEKGVVLDPAVGANGLFLGTMPPDLAQGTALQGIEMDGVSARIASQLYGLASIETKPFQDVKKPSNRFDLTITNVPFERITPTDLKHNKGGYSLHNYFINKMLNLTAPGALSMMITTSSTLDSVGDHLNEYAGKAQLVGAIRLPSGIYSATNVPTDILVFRKNIEGGKFTGIPTEEWTTAGEDESTGITINNYFLKHPEMVAGKLEKITGRFGNEGLRVVGEGDLQSNLERIAAAFPDKIVEREAVKEAKSIDDIISAPGTVKEGGAYFNDKDEVCLKEDGEEVKLPIATASEQKRAAVVRGYVNLLDQVRTVLRAQKTETDDQIVKAEQTKLKKVYDQFVKKFGPVNDLKNAAVYAEYTDSAWVIALEEYDPDTGKVTKVADIFTKNITGMASRPDRADNDHDALAMALDEFGYPNLEYMARLRNSDVDAVRQGVADKIVENPETGFLETMDEYLSGNVKRKLAVAREMAASNPEYARNVALLEAAQPAEIPQHRITARIGASWISPEHLAEFVKNKMQLRHGLHAVFNFNPVSNEWSMSFHGEERYRGRQGHSENKAEVQRQIAAAKRSIEATTVWGTERMDFFELMKCALMGKRPQVTYYVDRKPYLDEVATQAAEVKLQDIQTEFGRWLFADTFRADQAVKRFNDLINTSVPMKADGSHLTFPGKSMWMLTPKEKEALGVTDALTFYPHQMNAAWKYLKNGNLYLGHEVGTGKTVTMALIAMEAKRLRGKKKVLYVTLNDSTMGQAVQEIKNLYPMANVLPVRVSTNEQRKQRALQKLALNDFDVAIMRQQDLDRIGLSPESERVFIEEEIQELREILEEAKREGARILEQDIQIQLHALEEKLKAPSVYDEAKKKNLFFDDLGIDLMVVDEAHKYKNIPYATRLTRITGLNPTGSPTAKDFFRKTQYLNAQFPKKDAIVLASGTALSNSIAEMYNIQRMLQPQEVKRQGVWSFDRWIANYGDMGSQMEWDGARGQYKVITTNRRIVNAGRMLATAYQNVDSVRADDTPVKRPVIRGGEPQRVKVAPNQYVEDYKKIILDRCAEIEADPKNAQYEGVPDNMLRIISNMSKVAIDQRLDHHYANTEMQQDSKIAAASQIMYRRWKEEGKHKGVQLVFADLGIPGKYFDKFKYKTDEETDRLSPEELAIYNEEKFEHESASTGFNTYEGLKKELVKLGIPENQIAFIHDADHSNKEKKAANLRSLFKKVNGGDIRVLIGSSSKAGTGVNIQGRVSDVHHLDVWWNFSAWEQRNGRGIRAGNFYANDGMPGTYIWNYVTETTVDATRWDKVFAKGKVLNAVLGGDINLDVIEDISDETMSAKMMAAEASGDPLMSVQATLLQQVQGLRFEQAAHLDVVRRSRMDLAAIPGRIEALEKSISDYQHSRGIMDKVTAVRFIGDDRTLVLEKHGKEIAEALEKAVKADTASWRENKKAALLVFGSHTESEVVEKIEAKGGEQKEKKVKKYAFHPLPAKADITGKPSDPYGRRLLMSGDIISSDRNLADIKIDQAKKATVEIKANVSRTVTEFLTWLTSSEARANETIAELKGNEPKLQQVIDTPWAKIDELATKDKELRDVEAKMAARGVFVGDPTTGISIDKYKGIVPMLEDVAEKDGWSYHNGIVYPHQDTTIGIRAKTDLNRFLKSGKLKPRIASSYNAPDILNLLDGGKPRSRATAPAAYTVIDNETRFWVPVGTTFVTVDPVEWTLLKRIIGEKGSWHYDSQGYLVHVDDKGERDAFVRTRQASYVPQGVKDIDEKAMKAASPPVGAAQYSVGTEGGTRSGTMDLNSVQSLFPGQSVSQDGDNFTITLKNGAQATIFGVAEITPNAVSLNAGYKKGLTKGRFIAGAFAGLDAQGRGVIRIVRDNANAPWTVSHESVHWLEKLGVISEMDKATLNARIHKEGKWNEDLSPEENRANWLADFVNGAKPTQTVLAQIWQKIQDFISRIVGIRTAGMIGRELRSGKIFEREVQQAEKRAAVYGSVPVFKISESGLARDWRPRILKQEPPRAGAGGRVVPYAPESGILPVVKSEPIGAWRSSRRKIENTLDAAVIARDNLFRDANEALISIVTAKNGKILAVNQHTTGAPNQSQVYPYFAAGQIMNVPGAARAWLVHNHPSGQPKLSDADMNMNAVIEDLIAGSGIEMMPIIAVTPSRFSEDRWSTMPLPPKEPATYKIPLLGRKFAQAPEGLSDIASPTEFEAFGRAHMKEGGMALVSSQRQPVAVIAIDDYSQLRPLHTEILREAEKRNAVDFMIYDAAKTLSQSDIGNLVAFARNTFLTFTTVRDASGDRYHEIEGIVEAENRSKIRKAFYSIEEAKAYDQALFAHEYISPRVKPSLSAQEKTVRENAYGVKGMDPVVLDSVAGEMAALIPRESRESAILVPVPGHTGDTAANVALAERIAAITGGGVADVLKRQAGQSQRDARVAGRRTLKPGEFGMVSTETLDGDNVFFVDNVISSGATIRAARDAVGGGKGLVYAKSNPKGEKYALGTVETLLPKQVIDSAVEQGFDPSEIKIITPEERNEYFGRYGIPNAIDVGRGAFSAYSGKLFVDDFADGKPVAYLPPKVGDAYGAGYGEDRGLPKWIGAKVKKAFKKDAIASILLDAGPIQSGPLDGGCRVLAKALKRIEPTGKIITIEGQLKDGTWQAEHYGFELNGVMIDGDGHAPSREAWAKRFAKNEDLGRPYRITEGEVESEDISQDAPTVKKLADALVNELASGNDHLPYEINETSSKGKYGNFGDTTVTDFSRDEAWHDIAYREPTKEAVARLNAWLKDNPYATVRMYHGTDAGIPVMKEGLKPTHARTAKSLQSSHGTVSLSIFPGMANQFGRLAYPGKEIAVYPVDVLVKNLAPDTDQLRNKRHFGFRTELGETLAESIAIGHGAKVRGAVPVDWIRPNREQYSVQTDSWEHVAQKANDYSLSELSEILQAYDPDGLYDVPVKLGWSSPETISGERAIVSPQSPDYRLTDNGAGWDIRYRGELRRDFKTLSEAQSFVESEINGDLNEGQGPLTKAEAVRLIQSKGFRDNFNAIDWKNRGPHGIVQYSVQTDAIDSASMFPDVNERLKAAKGVKYASLKDRVKDALVTGWEHFTRHFQHLEPETDGAVIDVFRKFQDVPAWAKDETVRQLSGFIGKLSPQGREVFTMNILLPDMIRDIENGTLDVDDEAELPFGYKNRAQAQQDYDHFKAVAEGSPAIMEALDRRNAFMTSLTDQLIQHKLLKKEVANDPAAYFHHQVLAYINYKENPNWGMSSKDVRTHRKGWQVGRRGSQLDYNTEYVESEFEIISQALTQIETVKSLKEIERLADIKPQLEAEAKDQNMATFYRKANDGGGDPLADHPDPLRPFKIRIAMGFQKLAKLFTTKNDMGTLPMEFDDVIEHIVDQEEQRQAAKEDEIDFDPVPHPRMFALLNYLINHQGPGSMPAAMIFKAIAARNAFIKQVVGKDWVTYRDLIPEGYVAHKPETGSTFYFTNSIADQALTQVLAGHRNLPDAVRQVLARGRDEEWVVKEGISKTLNEFRPAMTDSLPAKMSKDMLTTWKQWILMNPFRVIKYNLNNMSGDLDIAMAYDPKIIKGYFSKAFKDLWAASQGKASEALMDELSGLTKRGVVGSGMTAMDIPELGDVKTVKGLVDFFDGKSKNALSRWYSMNKKLSTLRENILRLAANRYFMDRMGRGEIVYGASRKAEVDVIEDHNDKAAKLARELIGDYGNISHAGQYIRERMIPFYSWLEINAPRYVRLFRNLKDEGRGIGAMGGVLAWKTTKLAIKASALMGLVMLWNAAFFPDEEDELQEAGREQLHMILGRRADGSIITIRFQGALSDALSWFGMGNPVEQAKKVVSGTKGIGDLANEIVKAPSLKLFQGFRPEPKLLYEVLSGQSFFPDPMHPRPIRDTMEHILRTFSLDRIYNQASGKPKQGGTWATQMYRDIQSLALTESDPGEQAYYTSRKYIFDWLDKQGKEKPVAMPTNRSNSLYYYKQALKFGDFEAAEKYLKKYQDMGGKLHDVQGSIRRVHPLASLRLADRYKFKASLSAEQQETLSVATAWYKKHYVDGYREQRGRAAQ